MVLLAHVILYVILPVSSRQANELCGCGLMWWGEGMTDFEPEGRTFGKGQLDEDNELAVLRQRLEALGSLVGSEISGLRGQIGERLLERVTALENGSRLVGTGGLIADIMDRLSRLETEPRLDRIKGLESKVNWIQETSAEVQDGIERRLASIENELAGILSKPLIAPVELNDSEMETIKQRIKTEPMQVLPEPMEPTEFLERARGVEKQTLNTAEDRIRRAMTGHFSVATIAGVVRALRGEADPFKVGGWAGPPLITDHAFRFNTLDRKHCSYRKDRGEKCGRLRSEHSYYQAQPGSKGSD